MLLDIQGDMNAIKNTMNELEKLSDKEKAEKYFEDSKDYYDSREPITDRQLRQIYLDGLAEGRKLQISHLLGVEKENEKLKEKLKGFENGDVVLVGKNQTRFIHKGLKDSGYDMNKVLVVDKVVDAFNYVYKNFTPSDTILLENDLPDAFNN